MGAHRTTKCDRCDETFSGPKRDVDQAYGVHLATEHPQVLRLEVTEEVIEKVVKHNPSPRTLGHHCSYAQAITPLHDGYCDWCGRTPAPKYEWYEPTGLRPFWRPIEAVAA